MAAACGKMAAASTEMDDLLKSARVFMFITGPATRLFKEIFDEVYSHPDMKSDGGMLSINDCFAKVMVGSKTKMKPKNIFGQDNGQFIIPNIKNEKLDISFYYAGIVKFCSNVYDKMFSVATKNLLEELKKRRNLVSHNGGDPRSEDEIMDDLEKLCNELMDSAEKDLSSMNIAKARIDIIDSMKSVKNEPIKIDVYLKEKATFFEKIENKFIQESQYHLQKECQFGRAVDPFVKLVHQHNLDYGTEHPIVDVFTAPLIVDENKGRIDHRSILECLNTQGKVPKVVIISGLGGSGKSTLCHIIFEEWRNKAKKQTTIELIDMFDLVVYIEMKKTKSKKFLDFLRKEYLVDQMVYVDKDLVFYLLNSLNLLFIIDGYDEKNEDNGEKLVSDIASYLPKSRVIITTRPEFQDDCSKIFNSTTSAPLVLEGFGPSERKVFASKVMNLVEKDPKLALERVKEFNSFIARKASTLSTHLKLPLTMALLIFLWLEKRNNPSVMEAINTATQLYFQLFEMLKEKLIKIRVHLKTGYSNDEELDEVLQALKRVAFKQLVEDHSNELLLTPDNVAEVKDRCVQAKLEPGEILSAFLVYDIIQKSAKASKKDDLYSFFHRTQMEYFSAESVANNVVKRVGNLEEQFPRTSTHRRKVQEVFPFLAGCLARLGQLDRHCDNLLTLCKEVQIPLSKYDFWFSLLHETEARDVIGQGLSYNETMAEKLANHISDEMWSLNSETLVPGLKLLTHCPDIHVDELTIDLRVIDDPKKISELNATLTALQNKMDREAKHGEAKVKLVLKILHHLHDDANHFSDSYLKFFENWTSLVEFEGHIGEKEVPKLRDCKRVATKVCSMRAFNAITEHAARMKNLTKLVLKIDLVNAKTTEKITPKRFQGLRKPNCEINLHITKLIDDDLDQTLRFINDTYPQKKRYGQVTISGNFLYEDGLKMVRQLQGAVGKKLYVCSNLSLTTDERNDLISEALSGKPSSFLFEWNGDEL
ncbi:uncharacterized protein LOC108675263 isoform X2 [Hyalella azteca]|nr:uncharacterized protein LOC108675263 isoform X2 [Hyalella azteca]